MGQCRPKKFVITVFSKCTVAAMEPFYAKVVSASEDHGTLNFLNGF